MLNFTLLNDPNQFNYTHSVTSFVRQWQVGDVTVRQVKSRPGGPRSAVLDRCVKEAQEWFLKNYHSVRPLTADLVENTSPYYEREVVKTPPPSFRLRRLAGEIVFNDYAAYRIDYGQCIKSSKVLMFDAFVWPEQKIYPFQVAYDRKQSVHYELASGGKTSGPYPQYDYAPGGGLSPLVRVSLRGELVTKRTFDEGAKKVQLSKMKRKWDVQSDLVTDCVASINGKTLDLLTTLAELPETVKTVYDILKRILLLLVRFKREARRKALALFNVEDLRLGSPETYAKLWLEYRYGILPMMYTVEDALSAIEKLPNEFVDERKKKVITRPSPIHKDIIEKQTHRCLIRRRLDVSSKYKQIKNQLSLDPFVTAWELIPLSFVVDWVLTIGNFLGALTTPDGVVSQGAVYSVKTECNGTSNTMFADYEFYERILINPQSHISIDFAPSMSKERWLDLVSLVKVILLPTERKKYQLI